VISLEAVKKSPLFIIFLVVFIDLVGFGVVIPILPYYAKFYGASALELGWLMTSYSAMQFFFAPLWGRLSDRIGRRPVLLMSMCGTSVSMFMLGAAPSLAWLFIGRTFAGISGANISTATAYIVDVTTPENRAKGMGMIGAAFGLGFIFGPAIGGVLSRYGYSVPMYFAGTLALLNVLFATARLKEPVSDQAMRAANRTKRFDRKAFVETMSDNRTRLATIAFFVVTLAITQMEVSFALFMAARYGYDAQGAGWLLALMGTIMVLIQGGLIGKLSRFFGERLLAVVGTLLMGLGLMLLAHSHHISPLIIALVLLAIGNGITNPSLSSLASLGSKPASRGTTMGIYHSTASLARVLGPPLAGYCYEKYGIASPFLLGSAFLILACLALGFWKRKSLTAQTEKRPFVLWVEAATKIFRKDGIKGLTRAYGWKLVACFFAYYLVRDLTLYVLLPWLATQGMRGR
jgi:DHA1 family tetracycline resistance protein-like MFS transporter